MPASNVGLAEKSSRNYFNSTEVYSPPASIRSIRKKNIIFFIFLKARKSYGLRQEFRRCPMLSTHSLPLPTSP